MKVVHITHTDLRYDNRILKEVEAISAKLDYNILCLGVKLDENAAYSNRNVNVSLVNFDLLSSSLKFFPRWFSYFFMLIELNCKLLSRISKFKPDIIHCHDTMVLPAGVIAKIFYKSIIIYDAHELESDKNGQNKILSFATLLIEKVCWKKIDYLISVSISIIDWYNSRFSTKPSILVLNSPVFEPGNRNSINFHNPSYFQKRFGISNGELVFVYVGLLGLGRSIHTLLKIFEDDSINSHIVFVGYGELQKNIESAALKNQKVHYHEAVPHESVVDIIRSGDIGLCLLERVSLSDYYALPNKLFEYTFAGLNVLASNFPELESIVKKYELGICSKTDYYSLFESIKAFESKKKFEISSDIYELSWEVQANRLVNLYQKIESNLMNKKSNI